MLPARPEWRNGRRSGLKIRRGQPRESSTLSSGTKLFNSLYAYHINGFWLVCSNCVRTVSVLGLVASLPLPVIYHRKFDQRDRHFLDHYVLKDAHHRDLIAHFDADVIAHQRVLKF